MEIILDHFRFKIVFSNFKFLISDRFFHMPDACEIPYFIHHELRKWWTLVIISYQITKQK